MFDALHRFLRGAPPGGMTLRRAADGRMELADARGVTLLEGFVAREPSGVTLHVWLSREALDAAAGLDGFAQHARLAECARALDWFCHEARALGAARAQIVLSPRGTALPTHDMARFLSGAGFAPVDVGGLGERWQRPLS